MSPLAKLLPPLLDRNIGGAQYHSRFFYMTRGYYSCQGFTSTARQNYYAWSSSTVTEHFRKGLLLV